MTRTERATSLRAIIKDRSESKSGIDKRTPKGGAGTHNWGSLEDERDLEEAALYDEENDHGDEAGMSQLRGVINCDSDSPLSTAQRPAASQRKASVSGLTEEERQQALQFRKNALKSPGRLYCGQ